MEVWAENWPALEIFAALSTQWRVGMAGPTGLDYGAIPPVLELLGIQPEIRAELFDALRVMERAALEEMSER